ncbi:MAG: ATP-dependent helicase [Balneolaceae bacterium]|nr:MAG: ATP-dependent helicase [Balneolaceae bacterium]
MKKFVLSGGDSKQKTTMVRYRSLLNEQQFRAVFHESGPALVIAGAGTGKTRTLVYRVARLVESGCDPSSITLLTFTRRAADEMMQRAAAVLDERCQRIRGGTFHHYCSQLLHQYAEHIGYPGNFTILDSSDAMECIQLIRSRAGLDTKKKRFPKKSTLYSIFSSAVNRQMDIQEVLEADYPQFISLGEEIAGIEQGYRKYKEDNHVMDFDDLLLKTSGLLSESDEVRRKVASSNLHLLVDEYQDTNALQAELTRQLSSEHGNVMAVGDDAQSIYSFRGADLENMLRFPELFPGTEIIRLEENYRSTQQILTLANTLLEKAARKFEKNLYTKRGEGDLPGLVKAADMHDQSRFISQMILNIREQGLQLSDIAVLFRNGRDSFDLEVMLNQKEIPYIKFGGQKFTEAAHVKDVLAHLRLMVNPRDFISWNRVLMLIDGIGPKTAEDLYQWVTRSADPYSPGRAPDLSGRYLTQLKALGELFAKLRQLDGSVTEQLRAVVEYYALFCRKRYDDHPKRMKDLESFIDISGKYRTLEELIELLALDPVDSTAVETEASQNEEPPLVLSTIHSAKGLEWDTVFVIQCLDGILPSGYAIEDSGQMDEELRLMYVAVTRARERLFITYPALFQSRYGDYFSNPSRFLEGISENALEPWLLVEEHQKPLLESANNNGGNQL